MYAQLQVSACQEEYPSEYNYTNTDGRAVSCPLACLWELWLEVLQRDTQQLVFQNYIWENYVLLVIREEVYSRLQVVNNSCLGAKELLSPSRRLICNSLGSGEVAEEGQLSLPVCTAGVGSAPLPVPSRPPLPGISRCTERAAQPRWDRDVAALAALQPQEECSTGAPGQSWMCSDRCFIWGNFQKHPNPLIAVKPCS